jgi:lipoprotein NlpI
LRRIWLDTGSTPQYYPLVFTVFRLEYDLWGLRPAGYHAVNILLHAASALLLWRLLSRLRMPGAWLAALIFAVHPVHVESVAWVTELKNVLSGFFYLAAFWAALRFYLPMGRDAETGERRWAAYAAAFLLFGCALLSKTVTCSFPVAILLVLWWKRGRFSRFEVATLLPFLVLGAALALNTATLEKTKVGAVGTEWNLPFLQRFLIAGRAVWFYARKLVWPVPLTFSYPRWDVNAAVPWQYLFPLAALAALAVLWLLRDRIGRGPLAAVLFFALSLVPALGFFDIYPMRFSFVADHFQYLASIGLIALAAAGAASWGAMRKRPAMICCGAAVVAALGAATWDQCHAYRDEETLWLDTLWKNPGASLAWNNLGEIYDHEGLPEKAILFLDKAVALSPDFPQYSVNRAAALNRLGRYAEAIDDCNRAIQWNPGFAGAYINRAVALNDLGRYAEALDDCNRVIGSYPRDAGAYMNRGAAHLGMGQYQLAVDDWDQAISLKPDFADAYGNRAHAYFGMKNYEKALADVKMCQKLGGRPDPDFLKALNEAAERRE